KPAAEVVVAAADQTAPVADIGTKEHPAGLLKASLDYQTRFSKPQEGEDTQLVVNIGLKELLDKDGKNLMWYGSLQEFGTQTQAAQHWLGRAWEASQDECLSVFATEALARLADMEDKL
ncbi:MAG TPA: HK97-gp10 family putative phage morphogenesis protein, partial [Burkholderiaceae bacterium]|nr:HK97-gp10 family putative phage morphogenesis protein [Burkholderiaceae bacterium]